MAENEGMEGKDLALKEKHEFEEKILETIENVKTVETTTSLEGLEVTNYGEQYTLRLKGITFGIIDKDGKFNYNKTNFIQIKKVLEEEGKTLEELGLPDLEESIDIEEKKEKEENGNEHDVEEHGDEERDDEEKPKIEEDKEEKDKTEKDEQVKTNDSKKKNLIKLNDKVFKVLIPTAKGYGGIYLDPDKGEIVGRNKSSKEIEPIRGLSKIKGESSNKNIHGIENGKHKHVNALKMYQIDSRPNTGFAILRDGTEKGNFDVKFTIRKVDSNDIRDFAYVDIPLLASQSRMGAGRAKEISGVRHGMRGQGEQDRVQDEFNELNNELEVPDDITQAFDNQMKRQSNGIVDMKQFKEMLYKIIKEKLDK